MNTVFHFTGNPETELRGLTSFGDVHWILPALADGSYICAINRDTSGAARAMLATIPGVTLLPSRYSALPLASKHVSLLKGLLDPKIGSPTMRDLLSAVFAQNPHPVFDPDA